MRGWEVSEGGEEDRRRKGWRGRERKGEGGWREGGGRGEGRGWQGRGRRRGQERRGERGEEHAHNRRNSPPKVTYHREFHGTKWRTNSFLHTKMIRHPYLAMSDYFCVFLTQKQLILLSCSANTSKGKGNEKKETKLLLWCPPRLIEGILQQR